MKAVFDLDDTISIHKNRDYANAVPIIPVVEKIRQMKKDGWEIIIYTARGQVSCKGDLSLIEKNNRPTVEEWLLKNRVPYDALLFGKPLGDLYVDDKGMSLREFLDNPISLLHGGGSGQRIYRIGDCVKKDFADKAETDAFKLWMNTNKAFRVPAVRSYIYNSVYMDYIDGTVASDIDAAFTRSLVEKCLSCKKLYPEEFDIAPHMSRLSQNSTNNTSAEELSQKVSAYLISHSERLRQEGSFCHGDMILSNIIFCDGELFFLDARYTEGANSYLLDLAKLRMSLNGYERIFGISKIDNSKHTKELDEIAEKNGVLDLVVALEIMFILRCYRYKTGDDKDKVIRFALEEAKQWRKR